MEQQTKKPKIGIIGFGFVGKAVVHGFYLHSDLKIYDKFQDGLDTLEETINNSDFIFICVPTPMSDDGSQDLSIVYGVMHDIERIAKSSKTIILKSTAVPGTTRSIAERYPKHHIIFNPEFLTERQAKLDFINTARIILGGNNPEALDAVETMYRARFSHTPIFKTSWESAELVKYMNNCFFALKISFLNEFYDVASLLNVPFDELKSMWLADQRIGNSHNEVPGHDGDRGYGGKCFVKDINALIQWARKRGMTLDTLRAAEKVNRRVRTNKDWLNIKGATSQNSYTEPCGPKKKSK